LRTVNSINAYISKHLARLQDVFWTFTIFLTVVAGGCVQTVLILLHKTINVVHCF